MTIPIVSDIRNDRRWRLNFLRIVIFFILLFAIDYIVAFFLLKGVERNYGLKSDADVLMIGHSHLMLAVDKVLLEKRTGLRVAKYTREGVNIADRRVMLKHYFSTCRKKPEIVVLGIDPWLFTGEGLSKNSWMLFLPFMDSPEIDNYIKNSVPSRFDYLRYKWVRSSRFNATLLNASLRGYLKNWDNLKFGVIDTRKLNNEISNGDYRRILMNQDLMKDFSSTMDYLKKEKVRVFLFNAPVYKSLITIQESEYHNAMHVIDSISRVDCPEAKIVDLVPLFSDSSSLFFSPIHLNPQGQKIVTEYFATVLDSIVKGRDFDDVNEK